MTKENSLIHGKVLPGLLRFAIPVLAAMFLQALYGGADLLIVGQFASTGDVSGVSTGSMLLHVLTNLVVGLTMGVTVFVGQKIGEQKPDEAGKAIGSAILLFSLMGVILSIFTVIFTKPLALLLHAPPEAFAETCWYIRVCGGGEIYEFTRGLCAAVEEMQNLPKSLRERLSDIMLETMPKVAERLVSAIDGTVKYLFSLYDGECIESVLMKYKHGNTLCISSQVGCRMGCRFCASTIGGRTRDLLPSELLGQVIAAERDSGERVSNIVMMGIGEPLDNYENVIKFLKLVNSPDGLNIGYRHISLSTSGVVPNIKRLADEELPITLSISLHAATDEKRSAIMPINNKWNIAALLSATVEYYKKTGRRVTFEYTLIQGKNDTREDAAELATLLKSAFRGTGAPIHVNLIRVNEVKESGFTRPGTEAANAFAAELERRGVRATVRRRLGADVNAACGQLRRSKIQ